MIIKHNTPIGLDAENAKSSFETVRRRQWAFHDRPTYRLILGTLEMLILKTLALTQMHGYDFALRVEQISKGAFRVNPGSLRPR
jgi:hypothetical protein